MRWRAGLKQHGAKDQRPCRQGGVFTNLRLEPEPFFEMVEVATRLRVGAAGAEAGIGTDQACAPRMGMMCKRALTPGPTATRGSTSRCCEYGEHYKVGGSTPEGDGNGV